MEELMIKAIKKFASSKKGEIRNIYFLEGGYGYGLFKIEYVNNAGVYKETEIVIRD